MAYEHLLQSLEGHVALITVNRPAKRNALSVAVIEELGRAFDMCASEPDVHGLILTGSGEKAFVAGADISELSPDLELGYRMSQIGQDVFRKLEKMRKPSIAAINGYALGGGLELAMACTLRVAADSAMLGQPEVKLGITCGYAGTQRLPRLVGRGRAMELLLTGDPIDAQEAYRIGLVNRVVSASGLLDAARELMNKIIANGRTSLGLTMDCVDVGLNSGFEDGSRFEAAAFALAGSTAECRDRIKSFLEKRK